jgi:hypothetical protein
VRFHKEANVAGNGRLAVVLICEADRGRKFDEVAAFISREHPQRHKRLTAEFIA